MEICTISRFSFSSGVSEMENGKFRRTVEWKRIRKSNMMQWQTDEVMLSDCQIYTVTFWLFVTFIYIFLLKLNHI